MEILNKNRCVPVPLISVEVCERSSLLQESETDSGFRAAPTLSSFCRACKLHDSVISLFSPVSESCRVRKLCACITWIQAVAQAARSFSPLSANPDGPSRWQQQLFHHSPPKTQALV